MTDSADLERRYRRVLAFYPRAFRDEHEQEILSALMAGAAEGQRRPRLAESFDLLSNAISMRLHQMTLQRSWEYARRPVTRSLDAESRHPRLWICVRAGIGIWLVVLTAILYGYGRGGWWGVLLGPAAALHFYLAFRLRHSVQS
jgi:hypothetical protein